MISKLEGVPGKLDPRSAACGSRGAGVLSHVLERLGLGFADRDREESFRELFALPGRRRLRAACWAALGTVVLFSWLDALYLEGPRLFLHLALQLVGMGLPLVAALRLEPVARGEGALDALRAALVLAVGTVIALLQVETSRRGVRVGWETSVLYVFAVYELSGMRSPRMVVCGLALVAIHLAAQAVSDMGAELRGRGAAFLLTANAVGLVSCVLRERQARRDFHTVVRLRRMAEEDPLTGLLNRRAFERRAGELWRIAGRLGVPRVVALVDVDHFKAYNDSLGHAAGDEALRALGRVFAELARRPLDLAARLGGEEFVLVWTGKAVSPKTLGERVLGAVEALALPHATAPSGTGGRLTVSVGLYSVGTAMASEPEAALAAADRALYEAKARGRSRSVVSSAE